MILTDIFLANSIIWIINIIFFISLVPQLLLNYRLKVGTGLADSFILGSLLGQFSYVAYSFSANLPLVYRIMNPIYLILLFLLVFQRFYYSSSIERKKMFFKYSVILILIFMIIFLSISKNHFYCNLLGWLPVGTGLFKKMPQIMKVYFRKSVEGFSLGFIYLNIVGYVFEMFAALFLNLPLQVIVNDLKNIIIFSIFLGQFFLYKKANKEIEDLRFLSEYPIHQAD